MRLATYVRDGMPSLGAVVQDQVVDLSLASDGALPNGMQAFIELGPAGLARAHDVVERAGTGLNIKTVKLLAPILRPRKNVFCLGLNYRQHAAEGARAVGKEWKEPEHPIYFSKPPTCVIGPEEPIVYDPMVTQQVDWEVEFTVVIGRGGRDIAPSEVFDHIFGYTVGNDISARDLQFRHGGQWLKGKSLDTFAPIGPWIVTADELTDPDNVGVRLRVNGVEKQNSNTSQFIFDIPAMVSSLAAGITLEPGDLIMTGTPEGVGFARTPPEFLQHGDVVEAEADRIGVLRNPVQAQCAS